MADAQAAVQVAAESSKANAPVTTAVAAPANSDELVDRWFNDKIHNSPTARHTESWGHMVAAKEDLKQRLKDFLKK